MSDTTIHPFWKIVGAGVILLIAINWYQSRPLTESECYRLGSNERTNLCLASLRTPQPEPAIVEPDSLKKIVLSNVDIGVYSDNAILSGNIKSDVILPVDNVIAKVRIYKSRPKGSPCDDTQIDTQYVKLSKTLMPGDSYAVGESFNSLALSRNTAFNYCTEIVSAHYAD